MCVLEQYWALQPYLAVFSTALLSLTQQTDVMICTQASLWHYNLVLKVTF